MARIPALSLETASGEAKGLMQGLNDKFGMVPNIYATVAHSPSTLGGYLAFHKALGEGKLSPRLREQIALASAGANGCDYCASAHTGGGKRAGLDDDEIARNLAGGANDGKTETVLKFVRTVVRERGFVGDRDINSLREAGFGDDEIVEIFGNIIINIFTNYFNHIAETEIDFPKADLSGVKRAL